MEENLMQEQQPSQFPQSQPIIPQPQKSNPASSNGPGVFYYIAAISLINSLLFIFNYGFYGSLAITTLITYLGLGLAEAINGGTTVTFIVNGVAFFINAIIAGIVAGFGYLSSKGHSWVYIVGMVAYTLDALIMLWLNEWIVVLIHLYALYLLWRGWSSLRKIKADITKTETISPSVID